MSMFGYSEKEKIRLAFTSRMCYYNGRRGTDERLPPSVLGNYSVCLGEGYGTE